MTAFYVDQTGKRHDVPVSLDLYKEASEKGLSVGQLINTKYAAIGAEPDLKKGSVFQQVCASQGLVLVGENPFGKRSPFLADILDGKCGYDVAASVQKRSDPFGTEARSLFPVAVIDLIEDRMQPDRKTDNAIFRNMVALNQSINSDNFVQPVISYDVPGGAHTGITGARAQRVTEMGSVTMMLTLKTSERPFTLPTYGIGIEASDKALANTTLDMLVMTVDRYTQIEHDARVYSYISALFAGDTDSIKGSIPVVESSTLDAAATGNKFTHKAWVKFLARKRRYRKITHVIADHDTYLKWEQREGRPGSNNYDPTLARIDPQGSVINKDGFGNDVVWFLVDPAVDGGPVPADTIWALDKDKAIMMVKNLTADFKATEQFVLQRKSAMVWHWGEDCYRLWGDGELTPFDAMHLSN